MIGISLRHAQAAGLHLRHVDPSISSNRKQTLARTWWALHSVECVLTAITGRPRIIARKDCTVAPPRSYVEKRSGADTSKQGRPFQLSNLGNSDSSSGNHSAVEIHQYTRIPKHSSPLFDAYVGIDLIMHKVLANLYSARTAVRPWNQMQKEIISLMAEVDEWALQVLPLGVAATTSTMKSKLGREQLLLYFNYYSAKICITRPCLCRVDLRIKGQSEESAKFNLSKAEACIQAALDLALLLPETPEPLWLHENGPWWSSVHISKSPMYLLRNELTLIYLLVMQAIAVLLLELSKYKTHLEGMRPNVTVGVEKLTRWLRSMMHNDEVSARAYKIVRNVLDKLEPPTQTDIPDQRPNELIEERYIERNVLFDMPFQPHFDSTPQSLEATPDSFNDEYFSQANDGNFNLQLRPEYLVGPQANYQFGQAQMPLFYGNPYMTDFDQDVQWDSTSFEAWMYHGQRW